MKSWEIPIGAIVTLERANKKVKTTAVVKQHWDDDNENFSHYRTGLIVDLHPFTCGKTSVKRRELRLIQRENGTYWPCAEWGPKVGSFTLELVL